MFPRSLRWLLALAVVAILSLALQPATSRASLQVEIAVVKSYWRYEYDSRSSYPHRVYVAAELRNTSGQYVKHIAVRYTLRTASGAEIAHKTDVPLKEALAPGESTFFADVLYDDAAYLTASVDFLAFGDPASAGEYPYLPDPQPLYLHSVVDGGYVTYFGEIVNTTDKTWKGSRYSDAPHLMGVYYNNGEIAEWDRLGVAPDGHLPPGGKVAFRFSFERVPNGSFKLFSRVEPLPPGQYATTWAVENLQWELREGIFNEKEVHITARIRNTSDVPAEPDVWFVGRDESGQWIGWTGCFIFGDIEPGGYKDCDERISSTYMHVGKPEDIRSVEALVASGDVTYRPPSPPTSTPTPTPTRFPTPVGGRSFPLYLPVVVSDYDLSTPPPPTATPTPTPTWTPTFTPRPTPTPTPTWTPTPTSVATPVEVLDNHTYYRTSLGGLVILGEVKNNTGEYLESVKVSAFLYDADNRLVGWDYDYVDLDSLPPGEKTCFREYFSDEPPGWTHYTFEVSYRYGGSRLPKIAILDDQGLYDPLWGYRLVGKARNDESTRVLFVKIVGTLYDGEGKVLGCDSSYVDSPYQGAALDPGQVAPWDITSFGNRTYDPAWSYRLQAGGQILVSP